MAKTPDYSALAREYLNLMQQQMAKAMTHPESIEAMLAMLRTFDPRNAHSAPPPEATSTNYAGNKRHSAAASAASDDAIIRLTKRVERLERQFEHQLAALHAAMERVSAAPKNSARTVGRRATGARTGSAKRPAKQKATASAKTPRKPAPRKKR